MIPGLKVENDKIVLDVPQILLYKPLAAIYQADNSNNKEFAHKIFLYIEHVADKKGYCRTKGFSKQEAHKWAARNSGLKESYVPDKLVTDAIDFIKREFESHPVEDAIETNIQGIRASLTLISIIANELNNAITDLLDDANYIKQQYFLEVSSPGVERILRKDKHLKDNIGEKIEIKLFKPINKKKEIIGILEQINEKAIIVISDNEEQEILRQDIAQIKKAYEW